MVEASGGVSFNASERGGAVSGGPGGLWRRRRDGGELDADEAVGRSTPARLVGRSVLAAARASGCCIFCF
jgi:hypothetical protein